MEATPTGAASFQPAAEEGHDNTGHYRGQNVEQELLHRLHLLVKDSEDCPKDTLSEVVRICQTRIPARPYATRRAARMAAV